MYIDKTSIAGRRPLTNAIQFIKPSPEPSAVAASKSLHGKAPNFSAVPAQLGDTRGSTVISRARAEGGGAHTGAHEGTSGRSTGNTKGTTTSASMKKSSKGVGQAFVGDQKSSNPDPVNPAQAITSGGSTGHTEGNTTGAVSEDKTEAPGPSHPPYPRQRDARLKRPIAQQSGPVTDEGKAAVSRNAVKHGGYAMPTSGDESFASIEQSIIGRLGPVGSEQHSLARSISYEVWRIGSIERTVVELERDIDHEKVSLSQLAVQLDFPFADSYREAILAYTSEESLRLRVHGHLCGEFSDLLARAARNPERAGPHLAGPNARAASLIEMGREVLARPHLVQDLEEEFFEEFDAVMLDARLGRSSLHPSVSEPRQAGWSLPLVECWVYRNFRQIRVTQNRLKASLRMDLMTSPSIERALRGATSRLGLLLSDYRDCRPDISENRLLMLGYGPSRRAA